MIIFNWEKMDHNNWKNINKHHKILKIQNEKEKILLNKKLNLFKAFVTFDHEVKSVINKNTNNLTTLLTVTSANEH